MSPLHETRPNEVVFFRDLTVENSTFPSSDRDWRVSKGTRVINTTSNNRSRDRGYGGGRSFKRQITQNTHYRNK